MKKMTLTSLLLIAASGAQAQEVGQVISRTAVYQPVAVPSQTCTPYAILPPAQTSGGGALLGAIAGGVIGSQLGGHHGQGLATMVGVMGGAMLGEKMESQNTSALPQTNCVTQNAYENRLVGYNVVYEYAGKQYSAQVPQDPGPTIPLQVMPMNGLTTAPLTSTAPPTVVTEPRVVYMPPPIYRSYTPVYVSPPVYRTAPSAYTYINLNREWSNGNRRGHWR